MTNGRTFLTVAAFARTRVARTLASAATWNHRSDATSFSSFSTVSTIFGDAPASK